MGDFLKGFATARIFPGNEPRMERLISVVELPRGIRITAETMNLLGESSIVSRAELLISDEAAEHLHAALGEYLEVLRGR